MIQHPIDARELVQVSTVLVNLMHSSKRDFSPSAVVLTHGMWERASADEQVVFVNLCNIYGLQRRFETPARGGAFFEVPDNAPTA